MKIKIVLCAVVAVTVVWDANAALSLCNTAEICQKMTSVSDFCCPDGTTGTTTTCPTGWIQDLAGGTCLRASVDAGSDDKGYLETQYGTCDTTTEEYNCYVTSTSETVYIDGALFRCVSGSSALL